MRLVLDQISKRFGATPVLREVSLTVEPHELFFLLGPSGCGKTTLLRLIAGFTAPDAGEIRFGERRLNDIPPHRRHTGMVFQNYALWPHLTVAQNVAYGLEVRGVRGAEKERRVAEALDIVHMGAYRDRSPNQLSGGQQQRVALARALVIQPDVLLLDEPLSNLDARLRLEMREELRRIHDQTRITTIYVTHDQEEALSLADRIAVMREGRVEQVGRPRQLYRAPANRFVADFLGECNWLAGELIAATASERRVRTADGTFRLAPDDNGPPPGPVWLGFRPEAAVIAGAAENRCAGLIERLTYLGGTEQYRLRLPSGVRLKIAESNPVRARQVGELLSLHIAPEDFILLPRNESDSPGRDEPAAS